MGLRGRRWGEAPPLIHQASVEFTDSQVRNLPSGALDLTGSPNSGHFLMPVQALSRMIISGANYFSNIGLDFSYLGIGIGNDTYEMLSMLLNDSGVSQQDFTTVFTTLTDSVWLSRLNHASGTLPLWADPPFLIDLASNAAGQPLTTFMFNDAGNLTGGDGAVLRMCVEFRVFDLTTHKFLTVAESGWDEATRTFAA